MSTLTPGIFWYWNATPDALGIREQLTAMREAWRRLLAILYGAVNLTVGGRAGELGPPIRLTRAREGRWCGGGLNRRAWTWLVHVLLMEKSVYNMARSSKYAWTHVMPGAHDRQDDLFA